MTAEPAATTRTVVLERAGRPAGYWPAGYWLGLVPLRLRMPALVEGGRTYEGLLVAAEEGDDKVTLTFEDMRPER